MKKKITAMLLAICCISSTWTVYADDFSSGSSEVEIEITEDEDADVDDVEITEDADANDEMFSDGTESSTSGGDISAMANQIVARAEIQAQEYLSLIHISHGIGHIVNACASIESLKATKELMEKYPFVYGAFGIHPDDAEKMTEDTLNEIRRLCHLPKAVAIGEIGLDYYWHKEEREHEIQKKMFRAQMEIAREEKMPFMIHSRDAARDTLELVKECMKEGMHGGIIHCFSYGKEMAREYLNMGLYLGIGGVVTFKNAKKLKDVVEYAPLEQLVLETDSPYLSPEPNRGKRNSSLNLPYVAAMIAELKGISGEEVIAVTEENAKRLLFRK